jgi:DNA-binding transcriptional LysR family regulator
MTRIVPHQLHNTATIRYFYEVARARSFRKAADVVHIAASALNRHVQLLEKSLGTPLFERGRGRSGVRLTAAGELLLRRVAYALNELSTAAMEIDALRGLKRGRVNAAFTDAVARDFLPAFLPAFAKANPNIEFEIKIGNTPQLLDMLNEGSVDVVLAYDIPAQIGVTLHAEYALRSCVAVHVGHPFAVKDFVRLAECTQFPLALSDDANYLRGLLMRMREETGVMPSPILTTNSYELMRDFVERGEAISIQTCIDSGSSARSGAIVFVPLRDSLAHYSVLGCASRAGRRLSGAAEVFAQGMLESLDRRIGSHRRK